MDLSHRDFRGSSIQWTSFRDLSLRDSDFSFASLFHVDFENVDLENANFTNAILILCKFKKSNIKGVKWPENGHGAVYGEPR